VRVLGLGAFWGESVSSEEGPLSAQNERVRSEFPGRNGPTGSSTIVFWPTRVDLGWNNPLGGGRPLHS